RRLAAAAFYPNIIRNQAGFYAVQVQVIKDAKPLILRIAIGIEAHIGSSNGSCCKRQKARRQDPLVHRYGFLEFAAASLPAAPSAFPQPLQQRQEVTPIESFRAASCNAPRRLPAARARRA